MNLSDFWPWPIYHAAIRKPAAGYFAVQKVVQDFTFESTTLPNWQFEDWGYGRNKITQLTRNYVSEEEFDRVRAILARRDASKYTSVALNLRGKPKDSRSQGWCMLSLVISRGERTVVELQYRTTEVILKFAADIVFLQHYLLRWLDLEPEAFRFRFANLGISGVYFPYLIDKLDLVEMLQFIRKRDQDFFFRTTRFLLKSSYQEKQHHPFSPERVAHAYLWKHGTKAQIRAVRDYLEAERSKAGYAAPKDFHDESYVPRGRKATEEEQDE